MSLNTRMLRVLCQKNTSQALFSLIPKWRPPHVRSRVLCFTNSSSSQVELPSAQEIDTNSRSVFFGGLKPGTTEDVVGEYFSRFGEVENVRIVKTFLGYSRNYGFVCFKSPDVAKEVLGEKHLVAGKAIDVGRAKNNRVVYVGGLHSHFTEQIIASHFSKFGKVESVHFIDNSKLKSKSGYAFITFTSITEAAEALSEKNHVIEGCVVKVNSRNSSEGMVEAEVSDSRKIKVENLPFETTTVEQLKDYFEGFGNLKTIDLLINSKTKTCAAILMFEGLDDVKNTILQQSHQINGCQVTVVRIPDTVKTGAREKTIYLENLAPQTTEATLLNYFRAYGQIAKVHLVRDRDTGISQRCGVLKFRGPKSAEQFQNISRHVIDGFPVTVRRRGFKFHPRYALDEISGFNLGLSTQ